MNTTASRSMAWPGRGIASASRTAYSPTSTRALQGPDGQIIATDRFLAERKIPLTFALGHLLFRLLKKTKQTKPNQTLVCEEGVTYK